jgi:hypothetical protein
MSSFCSVSVIKTSDWGALLQLRRQTSLSRNESSDSLNTSISTQCTKTGSNILCSVTKIESRVSRSNQEECQKKFRRYLLLDALLIDWFVSDLWTKWESFYPSIAWYYRRLVLGKELRTFSYYPHPCPSNNAIMLLWHNHLLVTSSALSAYASRSDGFPSTLI